MALMMKVKLLTRLFIKGLPGYYPDLKKINYNLDEANKLLDKKWTRIPPEEYFKIRQEEKMKGLASSTIKEMKEKIAVAIRAEMNTEQLFYRKDKNNKILTLTITTADTPEYVKVAEIIARMWQTAGIKIDFQAVPSRQISKDVFKNRTYQILLYGEIMGSDPDPYAFWHSSQVDYPGLNLAIYVNRAADKILEDARGASSDTDRIKFYKKFQDLLMADLPAVFLYTPAYTWAINKDIKGVEVGYVFSPAERLQRPWQLVHQNHLALETKQTITPTGKWRNWYTRTSQKRMEQSMRVRVPPCPQF